MKISWFCLHCGKENSSDRAGTSVKLGTTVSFENPLDGALNITMTCAYCSQVTIEKIGVKAFKPLT